MATRKVYAGQQCTLCNEDTVYIDENRFLSCSCGNLHISVDVRYAPHTPRDGKREVVEVIWSWLLGGALTIPWNGKTYVAYKRKELMLDSAYEFIRIHEQCHVEDVEEWGAVTYLLRHLLARKFVPWRTVKCSDVERKCYERAGQHIDCK